jgi:hypothetical protein
MVRIQSLLCFLPFLASTTAVVIPRELNTTQVYKFSPGWIENLATRPNGHLLITRMDAPEVWDVDPGAQTATKLATFPDAFATGGLVEMTPDVWAVIAGKYSLSGGGNTPGSWAIWKLDLSGASPKQSLVKLVPESQTFNGIAKSDDDTMLIGDALEGAVLKMSFSTGAYSVLLKDPSMAPSTTIPFGINGMKFKDGFLYFTNIARNTFNRLPVSALGVASTVQPIFTTTPGDDFAFGPDGLAYIATNLENSVIKVDASGGITKIATVQSGTSASFGRGEKDKNTLYVGTIGGTLFAINV